MREIKFRAWYKKESRWLGLQDRAFYIDLDGCFYSQTPDAHYDWDIDCLQVEIMQFTRLKDKNGKEIYEGDIIKTEDYIGVVRYEYQAAQYHIAWKTKNSSRYMPFNVTFSDGKTWQCDYMEIIGNIYENPELLNQ